MDVQERRIVGSLLLLLGVSFFAVAAYTGQVSVVVDLLKKTFTTF